MLCVKCGGELRDGDVFCSKCGTRVAGDSASVQADVIGITSKSKSSEGGAQIPKDEIQTVNDGQPISMEDAKKMAEMGKDLGGTTLAGTILFDNGLGGCLFAPLILVNPFFWVQWYYKARAKAALSDGNLNLAKEMKDKSTLFAVIGWIFLVGVITVFLTHVSNM